MSDDDPLLTPTTPLQRLGVGIIILAIALATANAIGLVTFSDSALRQFIFTGFAFVLGLRGLIQLASHIR